MFNANEIANLKQIQEVIAPEQFDELCPAHKTGFMSPCGKTWVQHRPHNWTWTHGREGKPTQGIDLALSLIAEQGIDPHLAGHDLGIFSVNNYARPEELPSFFKNFENAMTFHLAPIAFSLGVTLITTDPKIINIVCDVLVDAVRNHSYDEQLREYKEGNMVIVNKSKGADFTRQGVIDRANIPRTASELLAKSYLDGGRVITLEEYSHEKMINSLRKRTLDLFSK